MILYVLLCLFFFFLIHFQNVVTNKSSLMILLCNPWFVHKYLSVFSMRMILVLCFYGSQKKKKNSPSVGNIP